MNKFFLSAFFTSIVSLIFSPSITPIPSTYNLPPTTYNQSISYIVITETPIPTPTFTPSPTPRPTLSSSSLDDLFTTYARRFGIDRELLRRIAFCESRFNPAAINGIYAGLFQFSPGAWKSTRARMGENQDPGLRFYTEESIKTAAFKIAGDGVGAWPNCGK